MAELYLVRHGESTWNAQRRVQGQVAHPELTELGQRQSAAAAAELSSLTIGRLLSSDLTRAQQTAMIIGSAWGREPMLSTLLREQDVGDLQGLTTDEAMARFPVDEPWDPGRPIGGHGESTRDVYQRMSALLASPLVTESPGPAVLVTHGDTIRAAIGLLFGEDQGRVPWRPVPNGSITTVSRVDGEIRISMWATDGTVTDLTSAGESVEIY